MALTIIYYYIDGGEKHVFWRLAFYKHLVTSNIHITETIYCSSMKPKYIQYNTDANVMGPKPFCTVKEFILSKKKS